MATSTRHGFLQFIESTTVAEVLASEGSILSFFRKHHPSETGPYGVAPEVMDTYVRSCGETYFAMHDGLDSLLKHVVMKFNLPLLDFFMHKLVYSMGI